MKTNIFWHGCCQNCSSSERSSADLVQAIAVEVVLESSHSSSSSCTTSARSTEQFQAGRAYQGQASAKAIGGGAPYKQILFLKVTVRKREREKQKQQYFCTKQQNSRNFVLCMMLYPILLYVYVNVPTYFILQGRNGYPKSGYVSGTYLQSSRYPQQGGYNCHHLPPLPPRATTYTYLVHVKVVAFILV